MIDGLGREDCLDQCFPTRCGEKSSFPTRQSCSYLIYQWLDVNLAQLSNVKGKSKIFPREFANFASEILQQLSYSLIAKSNGEYFCLGNVNSEPRAISEKNQ